MRNCATGVACSYWELTSPDTWSSPNGVLNSLFLLRTNTFLNLVTFLRTWHFDYLKALSRFYFGIIKCLSTRIPKSNSFREVMVDIIVELLGRTILENSLLCFVYLPTSCRHGKKITKVPRSTQGEKSSKDMASSRNLVSTIGVQASPKKGD